MRHPIHAFGLARCSWPREPRPDTPRRVSAAARTVRERAERERASAPLFAHEVVTADPAARLDRQRESNRRHHRQIRDGHARQLREARAIIEALHPAHAEALAAEWSARLSPRSPAYLLDWLGRRLGPDGRRPVAPRRPPPRAVVAQALRRAADRRAAHDRRARLDVDAARRARALCPPIP